MAVWYATRQDTRVPLRSLVFDGSDVGNLSLVRLVVENSPAVSVMEQKIGLSPLGSNCAEYRNIGMNWV